MTRSIIIISLLIATHANAEEAKINPKIAEIEINGILIPKDIYDAFKELDHMLSPGIKKEMARGSEKELAKYYFELGAWIRNNWVLRRGSDLSKWFYSKGIHHPDDMSGIILESYCRYLREDPLEFDAIIEYYVRHWKIREKPVNVPCENGEIVFALYHRPEVGEEHYYHIAKCNNPENFMVFEYEKGWSNPTEQMLRRIHELKENRDLISVPLYEP